MNLYNIQDSDRPMFVVASCWQNALDKWKAKISEENDGSEGDEPEGISLICEAGDLLL